jgi:hypothetical protein
VSIEGCELNTNELQEGINDDTEKRLRSRKKAHREQTENERWVEIYGVLFPGEDVPSCCEFFHVHYYITKQYSEY